MSLWLYFWVANVILAGLTFVVITVVVISCGIGDLKEMFRRLTKGESDRD
jgi:carbon starvation protein CstA